MRYTDAESAAPSESSQDRGLETATALTEGFGVSPGPAAREVATALLTPYPGNAEVLQLIEGVGWMAVGIGLTFLDGPLPFADAGGVAVATAGVEELQAALSVSAVAQGVAALDDGVISGPNVNFSKGHRKGKSKRTWDQHSGRISGDPEKKDWRMKYKKRFGGKRARARNQ